MASNAQRRGGSVLVELVRLAVVVVCTAAAYRAGAALPNVEANQLLLTLLGASIGYVTGGVTGRFTVGRIDAAERHLRSVSSHELIAASMGGIIGLVLGAALSWPLLLVGDLLYTLPLTLLIMTVSTATAIRIGVARGGDLMRSLGVTGRLSVSSPTGGRRAKIVDTSALIDGRIVDVCRSGFLEGALVVPQFVLYELQGLADAGDEDRRLRGRRGLDVLSSLQRSSGIALEVNDRDYPEVQAVDAKLVAMARQLGAGLVTVDANLGRVAEVQGVTVLNLHTLADNLRPPVLPGDTISVRVVKPGKETNQGVGYLADGTMVVVENGREAQGREVVAEVTSILSTGNGRMVFSTRATDESGAPRMLGRASA